MRAYLTVVLAVALVAFASGSIFRPRIPTFDDAKKVFNDVGKRAKEDMESAAFVGISVADEIHKQWKKHPTYKDFPENVKSSLGMVGATAKGVFDHVKGHVKEDAQEIGKLFKPKGQPQPAPAPAPEPAPVA